MNRLNLLILGALKAYCAISVVSSITLYEVKNIAQISQSISTLSRAAVYLLSFGYIERGIKDSKAYTYYITEKGLKYLEEVV